jgi:hypothetical protein
MTDPKDRFISLADIGKFCNPFRDEDVDMLELVRCRDCEFHELEPNPIMRSDAPMFIHVCKRLRHTRGLDIKEETKGDGFCSWAKRKAEPDRVDVVRCKDCKECEVRQTANYSPFLYCKLNEHSVSHDAFCCWGERKEDG